MQTFKIESVLRYLSAALDVRAAILGGLLLSSCATTTAPRPVAPRYPNPVTLEPGPASRAAEPTKAPRRPLEESAEHGEHQHLNHLSVFGGVGTEFGSRRDSTGFAAGVEYERRLEGSWGIGGLFELLGQDTERNYVLVVPVSYYFAGNWRVSAGPGIESTPEHDSWVIRLAAGYSYHLSGGWSLSPEASLDYVEGGDQIMVFGLALGRSF